MDTKQVIVVRKDLNMRKGKIAAQAAHASMKVFFDKMKQYAFSKDGSGTFRLEATPEMTHWMNNAFTKICVYVNSEADLLKVYQQACDAKLPAALIRDAGHTEFHQVPTLTCCAIGPCEVSKVDPITGKLDLL